MWEIDKTYRNDLQEVFDRLLEKKEVFQNQRPLPAVALRKIRESLMIE